MEICITLPDYKDKVCLKNKLSKNNSSRYIDKNILQGSGQKTYSTVYPIASFLSFTISGGTEEKNSTRLYLEKPKHGSPRNILYQSQDSSRKPIFFLITARGNSI
jgi:hypothetical protein